MRAAICQENDVNIGKDCHPYDIEKSGADNTELNPRSDRPNSSHTLQNGKAIEQNHTTNSTSLTETLTRVLSTRSNAGLRDPGPPPDGGIRAWTQAFMGHFVLFNTWGMITTFGVFQTYYTANLHFEPSSVSWIGSTQMLGHFCLGMFSGRALDGGYFYWVVIPGVLLASLGMFMTSLCSAYWQFFLAQGVLNGIGCGLQFTPVMSLVTTYFSKNRSLAVAIVASGSATGGIVYPTIVRQLLPKIGFAWTVRVMAFLMLVVGACYCSLLRPRLPPRKSGPLLELAAFRELPYVLYLAGVFLVTLGQFFAFYYVSSFGLEVIGVSYSTSVNLLLLMNGLGMLGRLIPSYFADRNFGPYNTLIPFSFISGLIVYCWALVRNEGGLYAFALTYGLLTAGFQGLFPATLTSLTKDLSKVGVRNGMGFSTIGIATLTGPPIAGALIQRSGGSYLIAQMWAASSIFVGGTILVFGRISITGWTFRARV